MSKLSTNHGATSVPCTGAGVGAIVGAGVGPADDEGGDGLVKTEQRRVRARRRCSSCLLIARRHTQVGAL